MTTSNTPGKQRNIEIKGARSNNLKSIDVSIPKNKLVVVTGLSGSGKSSLVIDTLFSEGQRRYVESLSSYARQFLHRMKKPDVDYIHGLSPAIAIEQKVISTNARSTVGSMTEVYDYLRLLFAKIGKTYSPISHQEVKKNTVKDIVDFIFNQKSGSSIFLVFDVQTRYPDRSLKEEFEYLIKKGYTRLWTNKETVDIQEYLESHSELKKIKVTDQKTNEYKIIADRFILHQEDSEFRKRIADSVDTVLSENIGKCKVIVNQENTFEFSTRMELDGMVFTDPSPAFFNYNNSYGACTKCEGYGRIIGIDENKVIANPSLSVFEGAISCWSGEKSEEWLKPLYKLAHKIEFPIHTAYRLLNESQKEILWYGKNEFRGIYAYFKDLESASYKIQNRIMLARFRGKTLCDECKGGRLRKEAFYVKVGEKTFRDLMFMPLDELIRFFDELNISESEFEISKRILLEIRNRLNILQRIGLNYLHLDRLANTLSGGESQRINLTRTLGSNLTSSMYILDEPSIGLHPRDTLNLIQVLEHLRNLGNTVIVIEHEEEIIRSANFIIDIGPGAGIHGGQVQFAGEYSNFLKESKNNLTAKFLMEEESIQLPNHRRKFTDSIRVKNAQLHNLQNISVTIPLNSLVCISGVSGSGKTTLIKHILYPMLRDRIENEQTDEQNLNGIEITGSINKIKSIEMVGQQGIGRSSRSNPATYVKAWDDVRDIFTSQTLSKMRGYQPKHFSFNVEGGRCENCKGDGEIVVEMQFLSDVALVCEDCNGQRFKNEILEVQYKNKNINDILNLSVEEALELFKDKKEIVKKLKPLADVGLAYLHLGQSTSSLSGGESQRLKIAYYLGLESSNNHVLFIFDEPTTGLHFEDTRKLLLALNGLIEKGHSVVVIEHNMDVLKSADYLIDLGPEGGKDGGKILYQGVPEGILEVKESYTASYLKNKLKK